MTSFKARVESSSLGTRSSRAARHTVSTRTAANIVRAAKTGTTIQSKKK